MTIKAHLAAARQGLEQAGVAAPRLDAEILLAHAMGMERGHMLVDTSRAVAPRALALFNDFIARRAAREPVSHIIGEREFWSLPFHVGPDVLDPRPDSETLIEAAVRTMRGREVRRILDLGTGSGCLLIALLTEFPESHGLGVDISPQALVIARQNARRNSVHGRAAFRQGGWDAALGERFDIVISNPPYIPSGDIAGLERDVRDYEPRLALDGGETGLDPYPLILSRLPALLAPGGVAILEFGQGQGDAVAALANGSGIAAIGRRADLGGIERCIILQHA
jgi:release factor glutamine methyltransferase